MDTAQNTNQDFKLYFWRQTFQYVQINNLLIQKKTHNIKYIKKINIYGFLL